MRGTLVGFRSEREGEGAGSTPEYGSFLGFGISVKPPTQRFRPEFGNTQVFALYR